MASTNFDLRPGGSDDGAADACQRYPIVDFSQQDTQSEVHDICFGVIEFGNQGPCESQRSPLPNGEVVVLDQHIDDPVNLLVDGRLIARGELVQHGDRIGVRITQIISQDAIENAA